MKRTQIRGIAKWSSFCCCGLTIVWAIVQMHHEIIIRSPIVLVWIREWSITVFGPGALTTSLNGDGIIQTTEYDCSRDVFRQPHANGRTTLHKSGGVLYQWSFVAPFWLLFLLFLTVTWFLFWRDLRSIPTGHCQACGYNLTGNVSGRCPECGSTCDDK